MHNPAGLSLQSIFRESPVCFHVVFFDEGFELSAEAKEKEVPVPGLHEPARFVEHEVQDIVYLRIAANVEPPTGKEGDNG